MRNFGPSTSDPETGDGDLRPIRTSQLKDEAYRRLKNAIVSLQLPPGALVVEARLAEQLGISKTPVRHALVRLEKEGLVHTVPFKGTYVHGVDEGDVRELFEFRFALEQAGVQFAVARALPDELLALRQVLDQTRAHIDGDDPDLAAPLIQRFHLLVMQSAHSGRLFRAYADMDDQIQRTRIFVGHIPGRLEKSVNEHARILDALHDRDADRAVSATRDHLNSLLADYLDAFAIQLASTIANPAWTPPRT